MSESFRSRRDAFLDKVRRRPVVMGILNVTPDSFFDGGRFQAAEAALTHTERMAADGCDIIDVGGESARPGAVPVPADEELARVETIVSTLTRRLDVPLSIDTTKVSVAARALELGAIMVNSVGGLHKDPAMAGVVAAAGALFVIMHSRPEKDEAVDIIADMRAFFERALDLAARAGIAREHIILDPGIGFAKTSRQNRDAILRLRELEDYGCPILIGASHKSFLGSLTPGSPEASLSGTLAVSLVAAMHGASIFRVHDVAEHIAALKVLQAMRPG
jgi:dihydropteroate synthase